MFGAWPLVVCGILFVAFVQTAFAADAPRRILLKGGTVYDGTGKPGVKADVLIEGDSIKAIGAALSAEGAEVLDASGMAVCPGFIDVHTHTHEGYNSPDDPVSCRLVNEVQQGITTLIGGMDGSGELDMVKYAEKIRKNPRSANIARLVGHSGARRAVIGREDRKATPEELEKMAAIIEAGMKNGAFGLSSGLEYLGDYVTTEEVIACAKPVGKYGGYYETHLRNEDVGVFDATEEAIRICREAGGITLSISHIKVGSYEVWHQAPKLLKIIDDARETGLKVYPNWRPSINWQSDLKSFDPEGKRDLKTIDAEIRKYWPTYKAYCFKFPTHPELAGKTLDEIAKAWKTTPAEALVKMWDDRDVKFEYDAKTWEDKKTFLLDPFCIVTSDGAELRANSRPDPLITACFPIFFELNRRNNWVPLETAVYKCTGLAAELLGFNDRGVLAPGMKADVCVFDPVKMHGEEHWDKTTTPPTGVAYTIVNGTVVMDHGKHTGALPGVMILKAKK
jgi:N-acyl-D-aspartate/D-glutamate deacylase